MHTVCFEHEGTEWTFNHNGDFSGDVMVGRTKKGEQEPSLAAIEIPCDVLAQFVAYRVMQERIARLEEADYRDILGLMRSDVSGG